MSSSWGNHLRFEFPIDENRRLVVGSYRGNFDFYITIHPGYLEPRALNFGSERPTVWDLFRRLQRADLSGHLALRTCRAIASIGPSFLGENSNRELECELEGIQRMLDEQRAPSAAWLLEEIRRMLQERRRRRPLEQLGVVDGEPWHYTALEELEHVDQGPDEGPVLAE